MCAKFIDVTFLKTLTQEGKLIIPMIKLEFISIRK